MPGPTSSSSVAADGPLRAAANALAEGRNARSWDGAFTPDNLALAAVVAAKELRAILCADDCDLARERAGELLLTVVQLVDSLRLNPDHLLADALSRHRGLYVGLSELRLP